LYNFNNDEILKSKKKSSISIEKIVKTIPILSSAASLISLIPRSYLKSPQTNPTQPGTDPNYIIMNLNEEYLNFNDLNQEQNQDKYFMELTSTVMCSIDNEQPEVQVAKNMIIQNDSNKIHPIFDINRKTTSPLNKYYETRLEELSFVKIFPYGINGYNNQRDQKITASAYGKCRIMSNDSRYQNNDYMFYLLAKIEEEKISNTINICSSRLKTKSNNRVNALHVYMKNLRGYSSYWNSIKSDLMAFLRNLGEPTWFITLSARDLEWPDMINALLTAYNKNNSKRQMKRFISQVTELSFQQRSKLLHDCPVVAARQFCKRFKALMKYLSKNDKILGGKIKDYWFRVEFQKRGSPHIHMLVWIEGAPAFSTAEGVKFIDDICTCSIPTDEDLKKLVLRLQVHKCTQTCYKTFMDKSKKHCRFGYLLPVSKETRILGADESKNNNNKFCIFKRNENERNINVYNLELLKLWQANMDIQPVGSLYGIAYYVAKYVAKEEPQHIQTELKDAILAMQQSTNAEFSKHLKKTTKIIMKHRERSAQEAAFILCGLKLKACSRTTIVVNSIYPSKRTRMVRKEKINNPVYQEDDFCENIITRYQDRPTELEHICLAEFATEYEIFNSKIKKDESDSESEVDLFLNQDENTMINQRKSYHLLNSKLMVRKKLKSAVLKTPYLSITDDPDEYYYSLLLLYFPFRDETKITNGYNSIKEALHSKKQIIQDINPENNCLILLKKQDILHQAIERIEILEMLEPEIPMETTLNYQQLSIVNDEISEIEENNQMDHRTAVCPNDIRSRINLLNLEQKEILNKIRLKLCNNNQSQAFEIIHGPGGVGKSFLAKLIIDVINISFDTDLMNLRSHVLVAAPTGVAAKAINGRTLHNAFSLPIEKFGLGNYTPLKG